MKVLVCCEESQRVTKAFRERGHLAFSSDIKDCSGGFPEWHLKGDCWQFIEAENWDLIIAHPPCTYLSIAGACNMYKNGVIDEVRYKKMLSAREFFMRFYDLIGVKVCIENPRAMRLAALPPYTQTIQPYEFGDPYTKLTCLWLNGLPPLLPNCYALPGEKRSPGGTQSWLAVHRSAEMRSKTFEGIARAMAAQWG